MLTQARLKELLDYDPETGEFRWRVSRGGVVVGSVAGRMNLRGYRQIKIDGGQYYSHRLAWLYTFGTWPQEQIDHINNVRDDNRIANLREASQSENNKNMKTSSHNTSGFKGVSFDRRANCWRAKIYHYNKNIHLGLFDTPESAHAAYIAAALKIAGEFANDGNKCVGVEAPR